jgi:hypothetical protein
MWVEKLKLQNFFYEKWGGSMLIWLERWIYHGKIDIGPSTALGALLWGKKLQVDFCYSLAPEIVGRKVTSD